MERTCRIGDGAERRQCNRTEGVPAGGGHVKVATPQQRVTGFWVAEREIDDGPASWLNKVDTAPKGADHITVGDSEFQAHDPHVAGDLEQVASTARCSAGDGIAAGQDRRDQGIFIARFIGIGAAAIQILVDSAADRTRCCCGSEAVAKVNIPYILAFDDGSGRLAVLVAVEIKGRLSIAAVD